jgi:hypothetical protein
MQEEVFATQREFNKKFPTKMFMCSNCNAPVPDRYECMYCGWRADGLLKTWGKGYKYTILETGITEEIFKPIELLKEGVKENDKKIT